jgi:hypothetical protein
MAGYRTALFLTIVLAYSGPRIDALRHFADGDDPLILCVARLMAVTDRK